MAQFNLDDYIDVQDRIARFWQEHPEGAIRTRLMSPPDDFTQCRYEASVFKHWSNPAPDATGYAFELAGVSNVNKTSHEENCETSAIGRAMANLGYATSGRDRPSRQEMGKVQRMQAPPPRPAAPVYPHPAAPVTAEQALAQIDAAEARMDGPQATIPLKTYPVKPGGYAISQKQGEWIISMAKDIGLSRENGLVDDEGLMRLLEQECAAGTFSGEHFAWPTLTSGQASAVIDFLKDRKAALHGR